MPNFDRSASTASLRDLFRPEAVSADTRAVNERLARTLAARRLPDDIAKLREAYADGRFGLPVMPRSPRAQALTIPGPAGAIAARVLVPEVVRGVYLHLHGGGWMLGANDLLDAQLELIGREAGLVAVAIDYRLAPEHVFPAAIDDGVAAARWLIEHAQARFGAAWLAIGGESAGAHLAASTLLRLRDAGQGGAFSAANLMFGVYDLSLSPSLRRAEGTPFIDRAGVEAMVRAFRGDAAPADPALSPLYADLAGLPPALFSVGTIDPLLDDTLFMHMRWQAAGAESELAVYPGGVHGFNSLGGELADEANAKVGRFLRAARDAAPDA